MSLSPLMLGCGLCGAKFRLNEKKEFLNHMYTHSEVIEKKVPVFQCRLCGANFLLQKKYEQHLQQHVKKLTGCNGNNNNNNNQGSDFHSWSSQSHLDELQTIYEQRLQKIKDIKAQRYQNEVYCVYCGKKEKNVVIAGCNHMDLCQQCESQQKEKKCPRCGKEYKSSQVTIIK